MCQASTKCLCEAFICVLVLCFGLWYNAIKLLNESKMSCSIKTKNSWFVNHGNKSFLYYFVKYDIFIIHVFLHVILQIKFVLINIVKSQNFFHAKRIQKEMRSK